MKNDVYLTQIKSILAQALGNVSCQVYLFGSRATGKATPISDFDIAVLGNVDLRLKLSLARELLADSNIPFKVDLVDLQTVSSTFYQKVCKEGVLLWHH